MTSHEVVSKGQWVEARKRLLAKEKEFTRMREQLSAERDAVPPSTGHPLERPPAAALI